MNVNLTSDLEQQEEIWNEIAPGRASNDSACEAFMRQMVGGLEEATHIKEGAAAHEYE